MKLNAQAFIKLINRPNFSKIKHLSSLYDIIKGIITNNNKIWYFCEN